MKNLLTILLILLPLSAHAWGVVPSGCGVNVAAAAAFCSTCTGSGSSPTFCWEITSDSGTNSITESGGCVISGADDTPTYASGGDLVESPAGKSGYSMYLPTGGGIYFTLADTTFFHDSFTITFDLYVHTWVNNCTLFYARGTEGTDDLKILMASGGELAIQHEGANAGVVSATTADADLAVDTWYTVTIKGTTSDVDPNLSITVNGKSATSNTNLTAWNASYACLFFGQYSSLGGNLYIKNVKVWNSWQN